MSDRLASDDLRFDRSAEASFDSSFSEGQPPGEGAQDRGAGERHLPRRGRGGAGADCQRESQTDLATEGGRIAHRRRPRVANEDRIAAIRAAIAADPDGFVAERLSPAIEIMLVVNRTDDGTLCRSRGLS